MNNAVRLAGVVAGAVLMASACGTTLSQLPPSANTPGQSASPAAATSPAQSLTGPVGTAFQATTGGDVYKVVLDKLLAPAQPDNQFDGADSGDYLAGAEFTITGVSGTSTDDVNTDAVAVGSNSQTYTPAANGLAAGTNFNYGTWTVTPGTSSIGWAAFQLPEGVTIASIQWSPSFGGGQPATWTVSGAR